MQKHYLRVAIVFCFLIAVLGNPACSLFNSSPKPTIQNQKLDNNGFEVVFDEQAIHVTLAAPQGGELSRLNVSAIKLAGGQLVFVNDPKGVYLPEIRYFTSASPTPLRILLRLSEYSPYSLHVEHDMDINGIRKEKKAGDGTLLDITGLLAPFFEKGVYGFLIASPEAMNTTTKVSLYESFLPGVFVIAPVEMTDFGDVDNVLVISFLHFPAVALDEIITSEMESVNLVNMVGLSLEDVANFQVLADNADPDTLTPFGEKTVQEKFSEVQTRTIKKVINIVQIIDRPCGAPDMEKKIFAMDPAPGTEITPLKDKVILYRCEEVSRKEIKIIDLSFSPKSDTCSRPAETPGVDVVEVIDTSGSMSGDGIAAARSAAVEFTRRLDPNSDRIGLVQFESAANVLSEITEDFGKVAGLISGLEANDGTAIDAGLTAGFQVLQSSGRPGVSKVLILLSDGGSDPASALAAAGYIKSNGVNIITVGVGDADRSLLSRIANTSQDSLFSGSQEGLTEKFDQAFQLSKRPVIARDLTVRFTANTSQYDVMENLLSGTSQQPSYGVVEWKVPTVMDGQTFQQQIVMRPLTSSSEPYGQLEISYDQCADGTLEKLPVESITQAQTKQVSFKHEVIKKGVIRTGVLEEYQTQQFVVETGTMGLFSVEIKGAGSKLPPEIVSGNGIDYLYPLYSTQKDDKRISLFFLKDPKLYWFYVQSNGPQDTGDFALNILDGETANLTPLRAGDPAIQSSVPPQQTIIYDIRGIQEGDDLSLFIQRSGDSYNPYFQLVSLDGTFSSRLYIKTLGIGQNKRDVEVYRVQGKGPYRLIATSDDKEKEAQFKLEIQKGDRLAETAGKLTFGQEISTQVPADKVYLWTFQGRKDQVVNLHLSKAAADSLEYSIFDSEGTSLTGNYWYADETDRDSGPTQLGEEDGVYTVAVLFDGSNAAPVSLILNTAELSPAVSTAIQRGQPASAPLVNNREDSWNFSGKAGEVVTIRVLTSSPDVYAYFALLGPDGNRILYSSSNQGKGQLGPIALPQNGDYVISVNSNTSQQGTYEITLNPPESSTTITVQGLPTATASPQNPSKNAKILLYENNGNLVPWIRQTLDSMGLQYTQVLSGAIGDLTTQVKQTDWDLIIIDSEGKKASIQGEVWDPIITQVIDNKAALIAEIWNLDRTASGKISRLLDACGIEFQKDLAQVNPIYTLVPEHPVFNEPNNDFSLINYIRYWPKQAGDLVRLAPNSNATLLAGIKDGQKNDYGVITSCLEGRVIIQTFSDHDFHEEIIKALWENYIRYVLESHARTAP